MWITTSFAKSDFSIVLYQPDSVISERVRGGAQEIASFVKVVEKIWAEVVPSEATRKQTALVVGLGCNRQATAWIVNAGTEDLDELLTSKLRSYKSPTVRTGTFAFALVGAGFKQESNKGFVPPIPNKWTKAAGVPSATMPVDDVLNLVLPEDASSADNIPDGFKMQRLEPLGGKILRPENWYYSENHGGPKYTWTVSKEDSTAGAYETGMKIQLFTGIKKGTGKTPEEFCNSFLLSKAGAEKVINQFPEIKQGLFARKGLEVEEVIRRNTKTETYHIIYSAFWLEPDMAVITVAGTPKNLWETYEGTFQIMGGFELIDMKRFEKDADQAK
jgi:hypothetical protein